MKHKNEELNISNITVFDRDGAPRTFDVSKIEAALEKALKAAGENEEGLAQKMAMSVQDEIMARNEWSITVEQIQDINEEVLIRVGKVKTARAFIKYRTAHENVRNLKSAHDFIEQTIDGYTGEPEDVTEFMDNSATSATEKNWHVKQNASVSYSLGAMILNNSERISKAHWLNKFYDQEIVDAYQSGAIHIHDLGMLSGYCAGWDLKKLIKEGLGGVPGKISSAPAKHLSTICNQMVNFLGILQNEWAGAQAFSSFDTYLAPFVKVDNLPYKQVKQAIQSFVYGVNTPSRWGTQAPFSNITLDWTVPDDLKNLPAIIGGEEMAFTYGDCQAEMDAINKAFIEVMVEGDCDGRGFAYPIPTYSITKDFDWSETENNKLLFEMAAKYGTPYFSNYVNSDMQPSDVRSMCCRLRLDLRELRKQNGGNFGAGENTGSIGVVTINMPRIAFLSKSKDEFYLRLEHLMDVSARSLVVKRKVINRYMEMGLYPYTKRYLDAGFTNHFSTLGLVGMNETCLNAAWIKEDLTKESAQAFTEEVLNFMREKLADYQEQYGDLFNLEATPAESTAYRFARHDKELYPDIITAGTKESPYYTNSSHLPVGATDDVFEALDVQDTFQTKYTSGTVFHAFLGERIGRQNAMALVKKVAENYKLPYFTLSPVYSVCEEHGYINGEQPCCPTCGKKAEIYSRITGYYRPVSNWNDGKTQEFHERKSYAVEEKSDIIPELKEAAAKEAKETETDTTQQERQKAVTQAIKYLFTTPTCPNCRIVKDYLTGVVEVDATAAENAELVKKYQIMSAPTLVVEDKGVITKYANASQILGFAKAG